MKGSEYNAEFWRKKNYPTISRKIAKLSKLKFFRVKSEIFAKRFPYFETILVTQDGGWGDGQRYRILDLGISR